MMITRDKALALVKQYNQDTADIAHYLESEAVMRELAKKLGENEDYYGLLGLLHDIDWGITKANPKHHLTQAGQILKEAGFADRFINTVMAHGYGFDCAGLQDKKRTQKDEFALAASETVTGLIYAYALMRGRKIQGMEVGGLKKKFKDKKFAANIRREIIMECEQLGLSVDEFLAIAINGIKTIANQIGLD